MHQIEDLWYSYKGVRPELPQDGFLDKTDYKWPILLENNFEIIKEEILHFLEVHGKQIQPYFNKSLVEEKSIWKTKALKFWNWNFRKNKSSFVNLNLVLKNIPGVVSAVISVLEPGSELKKHRGDTNGIIRCHLPIIVPENSDRIGFIVNEVERKWEEGSLLLFNDSAYHSAYNHSESVRIVLIIDVIKNEYLNSSLNICSKVWSSLVFQKMTVSSNAFAKASQKKKNLTIKLLAHLIKPILGLHVKLFS